VQVGLLPNVGGNPEVPMDRVIAWELDVLGSHGMASVDYPGLMRMVETGELRPQELVERVVGLAEGARLLPAFDAAAPVGVTLIDPRR
jgi:alcohol dehydrogenase